VEPFGWRGFSFNGLISYNRADSNIRFFGSDVLVVGLMVIGVSNNIEDRRLFETAFAGCLEAQCVLARSSLALTQSVCGKIIKDMRSQGLIK
jgi:hypothetical protein